MIWILLVMALAFGGEEVQIELSLKTSGQGITDTLMVSVEYPTDHSVELPDPMVEGLTLRLLDTPYREEVGGRIIEVQEYRFSGPAGSYEVQPLSLRWRRGDDEGFVKSYSLFIDHQIEATPPGELVEIVEPDVSPGVSWVTLIGATGLVGLVLAGIAFAFRSKDSSLDEEAVVDLTPAHEVALARWKTVLADVTMTVEEKAIELSALFREYLEAQLRFPASAWTTTESMGHLAELAYLEASHLQGAKRILRATDWVKYAEASTQEESLRALDSDLVTFIEATRPHKWEAES